MSLRIDNDLNGTLRIYMHVFPSNPNRERIRPVTLDSMKVCSLKEAEEAVQVFKERNREICQQPGLINAVWEASVTLDV